ncbi:hypothetical protein O3M35_010344 [Rhynocoris fuscipes]|uniref:Uncharacterized protein n=1 Tax=Rhynocoris fuscipes TaxID=488301 RepID=A0AAW1CYJ5_9HEMI
MLFVVRGKRQSMSCFECQLYDDLRMKLWRKIGFNVTLNHISLPLLVENKNMYEGFKVFATQALNRRMGR